MSETKYPLLTEICMQYETRQKRIAELQQEIKELNAQCSDIDSLGFSSTPLNKFTTLTESEHLQAAQIMLPKAGVFVAEPPNERRVGTSFNNVNLGLKLGTIDYSTPLYNFNDDLYTAFVDPTTWQSSVYSSAKQILDGSIAKFSGIKRNAHTALAYCMLDLVLKTSVDTRIELFNQYGEIPKNWLDELSSKFSKQNKLQDFMDEQAQQHMIPC